MPVFLTLLPISHQASHQAASGCGQRSGKKSLVVSVKQQGVDAQQGEKINAAAGQAHHQPPASDFPAGNHRSYKGGNQNCRYRGGVGASPAISAVATTAVKRVTKTPASQPKASPTGMEVFL